MVIHTTLAFPDNCKFQKVVESIGDDDVGKLELVLRRWFIASGTTKPFHEPTVAPGTNPYRNQPHTFVRFDAESFPVSSFGKYLNGRVIAFFFSPPPSISLSTGKNRKWIKWIKVSGMASLCNAIANSKFPFEKSRDREEIHRAFFEITFAYYRSKLSKKRESTLISVLIYLE